MVKSELTPDQIKRATEAIAVAVLGRADGLDPDDELHLGTPYWGPEGGASVEEIIRAVVGIIQE